MKEAILDKGRSSTLDRLTLYDSPFLPMTLQAFLSYDKE